jgi:hypothetical protein
MIVRSLFSPSPDPQRFCSGHKDREVMRTYICGLHPRGQAFQDGRLKPGDQLLKVSFLNFFLYEAQHIPNQISQVSTNLKLVCAINYTKQ